MGAERASVLVTSVLHFCNHFLRRSVENSASKDGIESESVAELETERFH